MRAERTRPRKLKKTKMGEQEVKEGREEIQRMLVRQRYEARDRVALVSCHPVIIPLYYITVGRCRGLR